MSRTDVSQTSESGLIPDTPTKTFLLVKKNKRLMIVDSEDNLVYHPPNFLKPVTSRKDFQEILDDANLNGCLSEKLLTDFETKFNPRAKKVLTKS
jgi:hypothetical protein